MQHRRTKWVWTDGFSSGVWRWECSCTFYVRLRYENINYNLLNNQLMSRSQTQGHFSDGSRSLGKVMSEIPFPTVSFSSSTLLICFPCSASTLLVWHQEGHHRSLQTVALSDHQLTRGTTRWPGPPADGQNWKIAVKTVTCACSGCRCSVAVTCWIRST